MDRQCYYIELNCSSIDEAKKRALVLAYLTYDVREHNFVRLNTGQMMTNPYIMKMMYRVFDTYNIDPSELDEETDLKSVVAV